MRLVDRPTVKADKSFEPGNLYALGYRETPYMYCRISRDAFMLVNAEDGNWWIDDMHRVDPNDWVDVTHLYELRRLANG